MCLLSYYPPGVQPSEQDLVCGAACNPHGFGYAIVIPGVEEILVGKGMDSAAVIAQFLTLRKAYPNGPALFHSRYTTHGVSDEDNCHPFIVGGDKRTVLAHNGILPGKTPGGASCHPAGEYRTVLEDERIWKTVTGDNGVKRYTSVVAGKKEVRRWFDIDNRSDTRILAEDIFMAEFRRMDRGRTRRKLESWLGSGNKVVVLTTDPFYQHQSYIFNEMLGDWVGEPDASVWHSNDGYLPYRGFDKRAVSGHWWDDDEWNKPILGSAASRDRFTGSEDDPEVWPVTLGGTREVPDHIAQVDIDVSDCDMCGQFRQITDIGLCAACGTCNLCLENVADCNCFFKARPHLLAFRELKGVLRWGSDVEIIEAYEAYANVCMTFDKMKDDRGTDAWKQREKDQMDATREAVRLAIESELASDADSDAVDAALRVWDDAGVTSG